MNYNKSLLSILWISLLTCFTLKPAIESYALFQELNKKVLVFGDIAASDTSLESNLAKLDAQDSEIIFSFIKKVSRLRNPSKFILQASESDLSHKKNVIKLTGSKDLYYCLPYYARQNNYSIGSISFCLADNQESIVRNFINMFTLLDNPLARNPQIFFSMKDKIKTMLGKVGTVEEFFKETKTLIKQFQIIMQDDSLSKIVPFLETILNKVKDLKKMGKQSFTFEELKTSYVDVFAYRFFETKNLYSMLGPLYQWILPLTDNLLDCNLIIETAKALKNHDQVIIFSTNNHAISLHNFLKYYDFELIYIQGLAERSNTPALFKSPRFNRDDFAFFLSNVFCESSSTPKTNCAYCNEPICNKKCGHCKLAFYCTQQCQKKHWPLHKFECKKK